MEIDARKLGIPEENCEQMKTVASKVGVQVVCSEDDVEETGINLSAAENCENIKETVSKYGVAVVCDEEK